MNKITLEEITDKKIAIHINNEIEFNNLLKYISYMSGEEIFYKDGDIKNIYAKYKDTLCISFKTFEKVKMTFSNKTYYEEEKYTIYEYSNCKFYKSKTKNNLDDYPKFKKDLNW